MHIIEEGFTEGRGAADQFDWFRADAFGGHIKEQEANTFVLGAIEIGTNQAENPVSFICVRRPDFRTVDEVVITHVLGFSAQTGQVRACIGLTVALAPADFAVDDVWDVLLLLLFCRVEKKCRTEHI